MKNLRPHLPAFLLFAAALCLGLCNYDRYGITWDEDDQHKLGELNYNYVFLGDTTLRHFVNRDYGPAVELPLATLEKWRGLTDTRDVYLFRHLCLHLFFLGGLVLAYLLLFGMYQNTWLALAGPLLILTAPHIYAHSFTNSKDIPFLTLIVASFFAAQRVFRKPNWLNASALGIVAGLAVGLRVIGLIPIGLIGFFLLTDLFRERKNWPQAKIHLRSLALIALGGVFGLVAFWPMLWANPVKNFLESAQNMAHFRWVGLMLFNGRWISSEMLPWNYLLVWIGATTPPATLALGLVSLIWFRVRHWLGAPSVFSDLKTRMNYLFFITFFGPLAAVWVMNPILLDGWRHLFFIFPPFVFLGIFGLEKLWATRWRWAAALVLAASVANTAWFMAKNNPFQQVYFNSLCDHHHQPNNIRKSFELDFWGGSYRQGLEYILQNDTARHIKIAVDNFPGKANLMILPPADRARFEVVPERRAGQYFLTNYRNHPEDFTEFEAFKWHSLVVDGEEFLTIFKFPPADSLSGQVPK